MSRMGAVFAALIGALFVATIARADGGVVLAEGPAGPFEITVLASPSPLRAGPSEWSVLVRRSSDGEIALDARVEIVLGAGGASFPPHGSTIAVEATRSTSANRLLHTARLDRIADGSQRAEVRVRDGQSAGSLSFEVSVAPARSPWEQQWRSLALPPVALALFAIHQMLVRRRGAPRRRTSG
jgi:hypothetical protein